MIIGIDISTIPYGTGVSNYTLNLVTNLISQDKINTYKLFFSSLRLPFPKEIKRLIKHHPNLRIYNYKFPPTLLHFLWNILHILPIELFIGKCDIFHTSDWTQPPSFNAKLVTTIHDLTPFTHPQWHHPKVIKTHTAKLNRGLSELSGIICVSQNTLSDFKKIFPQSNIRSEVIYEAAEDKYSQFRNEPEAYRTKIIRRLKKRYHLKNFVLAQGTREPRKNLDNLIKAFMEFKDDNPDSDWQLAVAGKYGWGDDVTRKLPSYIKILGYIPENDMVSLHAASIALVYPSLYEGFGLPVVKAMALGLPIITSNNSSLAEIASDCAILIDPTSIRQISEALTEIYKSTELRTNLSQKSLIRSAKFSWKITAKNTLSFYRKL